MMKDEVLTRLADLAARRASMGSMAGNRGLWTAWALTGESLFVRVFDSSDPVLVGFRAAARGLTNRTKDWITSVHGVKGAFDACKAEIESRLAAKPDDQPHETRDGEPMTAPPTEQVAAALAVIDECLDGLRLVHEIDTSLPMVLGRARGPLKLWRRNTAKRLAAAGLVNAGQELLRLSVLGPADPVLNIPHWINGYGRFLEDVRRMVEQNPSLIEWELQVNSTATAGDRRHVAVVHGRNEPARNGVFAFLRALGLEPIEWQEAIRRTGSAAPYVGQIVDMLFAEVQAVVVVLTGDEDVQLRAPFRRERDDSNAARQSRPNVFFEAGMAFARHPDRTLVVQIGEHRSFSDIFGRHVVHMTGDSTSWEDVRTRLKSAGCAVKEAGTDWLSAGQAEIDRARII
jgi:predicted nucleotide-binding protein